MEENLIASNVTGLDKKGLSRLHKYQFFRQNIFSFIVFPVLIVIFGAILAWVFDDLIWGIALMALGALFGIFYPLTLKILLNRNPNNKLIKAGRLANRYDFFEDYLLVQTKLLDSEQPIGMSKVFYRDITKVLIDNDYLFVFINKVQCFVIGVNGMLDGTIADIKILLKRFCPNFVLKNKG